MSTPQSSAEERREADVESGRTAQTDQPGVGQQAERAAKVTGRLLLWLLVGILAVVAIVGIFLVGPIALITIIPALILIWFIASAASGGPATGA
jgi:hypothetical protein